jgi:hypothetical protein
VNFLFAIKLSSDFLQDSNIYKLSENQTQILCPFHCSCIWNSPKNGTILIKANNLLRTGVFVGKWRIYLNYMSLFGMYLV